MKDRLENCKERQRAHRISKEDEDGIYRLIGAELRSGADETKTVCADNDKRQGVAVRRLCYEDLTTLLRKTGISYRELFEQISHDPAGNAVTPGWATEIEAKMCAACDMLSPEQQKLVLALVRGMLAPAFSASSLDSPSPMKRLAQANALRAYSIGEQRDQMRALGIEGAYLRRRMPYSYNALQLHLIPYVAKGCDVSPHWLLGLGETATVLAETTGAELIMDLFCFLPEERKTIILNIVDTALNGRYEEENDVE